MATAMMLVDPDDATAELDRLGLAGLVVDVDGIVHRSQGFAAFAEATA